MNPDLDSNEIVSEGLDRELIGALLGLVVHDLRNPLSALHSNTSFLGSAAQPSGTELREALEDVGASCEAIGHIIDNLELFAMYLREERRFDKLPVLLHGLVLDTVNRARVLATSYRTEVVLEWTDDLDVRVQCNREMLARSLSNLIRNAIQHGVESTKVVVSVHVEASQVTILVLDGGVQLSRSLWESAFTPAGQLAAKGITGGRYSRGLGLWASRIAADFAGATVLAQPSTDSRGNCFALRLQR